MKPNSIASATTILLLGTGILCAQKVWEKKLFTEWNQSEVNRILADSPWARPTASRGSTTTVAWYSSLTVREALARQAQLQQSPNLQQRLDSLTKAPEHYVLVVYRLDDQMFYGSKPLAFLRLYDREHEEILRRSAYLQPRRSKKKIAPIKVDFVREGDHVMQIVCVFPREVEASATISPEETDVEFGYEWGRGHARVIFSLGKMVRDGKPDL